MRLRNWLIGLAIGTAAAGMLTYTWNRSGQHGDKGQAPAPDSASLSLWVYSKGWDDIVHSFGQKHPNIDVNVRTFRSYEQLYTELLAAISANAAPQLAEIHSFYGIAGLMATGAMTPAGDLEAAGDAPFVPAFTAAFRIGNKNWAMPLGGSLPLLYYREEPVKRAGGSSPAFGTWDEVMGGVSGKLAMDKEVPWFFASLGYAPNGDPASAAASRSRTFELWRNLVHGSGRMKPLQHDTAASDFINGKAGMFIGSSEKLPVIERYIGGKFQFELEQLPVWEQTSVMPGVHGLAVTKSDGSRLKATQTFLSYMAEPDTQSALWSAFGLIPSRADVIRKLEEEPGTDERRKRILEAVPQFVARNPDYDDFRKWKQTERKLEQLELNPAEPAGDTRALY
ncbi:hypothetical protein SD70_05860 [Gordoniibacillus kamchatkensis]|uniref:Extracellular solute-binding protein n=1 Tax=Gordoniibacillus kamchatkensis TaxID=1590651 RepID=A0ABR5AKU1_9BACL|nr:extracellular solute-binding protein [Paenibacillus sp. VKM B-2647]KIL41644.1 hypothetical protein SD70_05860 [Paenibacillus sp. VKM B-2647]